MQIRIFTIPIGDNGALQEEMNRFLRHNNVLEVDHQLISTQHGAFWCFCVKFIESSFPVQSSGTVRVDYKQELDEETFAIFARLREIRKQLALEDAVPAYAVCTDQELASMAKQKEISERTLKNVKGFGEKKMEKYGLKIVNRYHHEKNSEKDG